MLKKSVKRKILLRIILEEVLFLLLFLWYIYNNVLLPYTIFLSIILIIYVSVKSYAVYKLITNKYKFSECKITDKRKNYRGRHINCTLVLAYNTEINVSLLRGLGFKKGDNVIYLDLGLVEYVFKQRSKRSK